jgi:hypothetical protein
VDERYEVRTMRHGDVLHVVQGAGREALEAAIKLCPKQAEVWFVSPVFKVREVISLVEKDRARDNKSSSKSFRGKAHGQRSKYVPIRAFAGMTEERVY